MRKATNRTSTAWKGLRRAMVHLVPLAATVLRAVAIVADVLRDAGDAAVRAVDDVARAAAVVDAVPAVVVGAGVGFKGF